MRVFQILNDEVLIINDKKEYKDSVANFKLDSGITTELPVKSIYDDMQKLPVIQYAGRTEEWKVYPVQELETYIDSVHTYLDAQAKRVYVAPSYTEDITTEQTPSLSERVSVLEDAVNNLMEGVTTTNG